MVNLHSLVFFDISSVIVMTILAFLSKSLGDALKIKPYYKILFITGILVVFSSGLDILAQSVHFPYIFTISFLLRFIAGATAFFVCLRYWKWLFSEFLKN